MPALVALSQRLEETFRHIDELSHVVQVVRRAVLVAQDRVEETSKAYTSNPIDKMLSSIRVPFFSVRHTRCSPSIG